ncbi:serine hydrolase, partial [Salmonella sp. SAL4436]|uniref:serine hydrolase n=1 Tax=Salmonella sp. SAL4436 TaxID=3159891 RepID=UPI00397846F4
EPGRSLFATYALGWQVFDWRGERVVAHGGAMNGQLTATALIPGRGVGIAVLTNAEETGVQNGLRNALLDRLMGAPAFDWVAYYR